jgi:hypothetical protein
MRVTIVLSDNVVLVDFKALNTLDLSELDPGIHAIQWNNDAGHIEYTDGRENEIIADTLLFDNIVARHAEAIYAIEHPVFTLDEMKTRQKGLIKASFGAAPLAGLMTSLGYRVDADRQDKSNVEELLDYCTRMGLPGTDQFRIHDNSFVAVSIADLQTIINEIQVFGLGLYAIKWTRELAIDAATTADQVTAIVW